MGLLAVLSFLGAITKMMEVYDLTVFGAIQRPDLNWSLSRNLGKKTPRGVSTFREKNIRVLPG